MSWRLRPARRDDAAALAAFAERTFRETFAADNSAADMDAYCASAFGTELQAAEIDDPTLVTLLAVDEAGRLTGYVQAGAAPASASVASRRPWELRRLYIDARLKGAGLAGVLVAAVLDAARAGGADLVWLGVWEHNPRAIAFYEKHGFAVVGEHTFMLGGDRQRDLLMARRLGVESLGRTR